MPDTTYRFLALGDSYTIGESVDPSQSWPNQLSGALRGEGLAVEAPDIIAQTGWTARDLLSTIERLNPQAPYDLVTLLIGVNDQYEGGDLATYRAEFCSLLEMAINFTGGCPSQVLVLSIPDWSVTPFARGRDRARIRAQIDVFNHINKMESQSAGVHTLDITTISRQVLDDRTLLAPDGLHLSEKMYAAWVDLLVPLVTKILHSKERELS